MQQKCAIQKITVEFKSVYTYICVGIHGSFEMVWPVKSL